MTKWVKKAIYTGFLGIYSILAPFLPNFAHAQETTQTKKTYTIKEEAKGIFAKYYDKPNLKEILKNIDKNKDYIITRLEVLKYENPETEIFEDPVTVKPKEKKSTKTNLDDLADILGEETKKPTTSNIPNDLFEKEKPPKEYKKLPPPKKPGYAAFYQKNNSNLESGIQIPFPGEKFDINTSFYTNFLEKNIEGQDVLSDSKFYRHFAEAKLGFDNIKLDDGSSISISGLMSWLPQDSLNKLLTKTVFTDPVTDYEITNTSDIETTEESHTRSIIPIKYRAEELSAELSIIRETLDILTTGKVNTKVKDDLGNLIEDIDTPIKMDNILKSNGFQINVKIPLFGLELLTSNEGTSITQGKKDLAYLIENTLGLKTSFDWFEISALYNERFDEDRINDIRERYKLLAFNTNLILDNLALNVGKSVDGAFDINKKIEDKVFNIGTNYKAVGKNFYHAQAIFSSSKLKNSEAFDYLDAFSRTSFDTFNVKNLPGLTKLRNKHKLNDLAENPKFLAHLNVYHQLDENMKREVEMDLALTYFINSNVSLSHAQSKNNQEETRDLTGGFTFSSGLSVYGSIGDIRQRGSTEREPSVALAVKYQPKSK